jgi:uncharacterized glyoxalase superfamily protein PhnB
VRGVTLGGKIETMLKFSEAPPDPNYPKVEGDAIMHASTTLDGQRLMASDMRRECRSSR